LATTIIANGAPVIPDGEFWSHPTHKHVDRYGSNLHSASACDIFHNSVVSADTKFWMMGNGGAYITTFAEINTGVNINTNLSSGYTPYPIQPGCETSSAQTLSLEDITITWDTASESTINFLSGQTATYYIWNETPPTAQSTASEHVYMNGIHTKVGLDYDWELWNKDSTGSQFIMGTGNSGHYNTDISYDAVSNIWHGETTPSTESMTQRFTDAIRYSWGHFVSASVAGTGRISLVKTVDAYNSNTEGLHTLKISSKQQQGSSYPSVPLQGAPAPPGFTGSFNYSASFGRWDWGWEELGVSNKTFYHDYNVQSLIMNKGVNADVNGTQDLSPLGLERSTSYPSLNLNCVVKGTESYKRSITYGLNYNSKRRFNEYTKYLGKEVYIKFADKQTRYVKRPMCTCVELYDWFNIPYQTAIAYSENDPHLYRLTFDDGYSFVAGGLLRLYSYNPTQLSATTYQIGYPGSDSWPADLSSRSVIELYESSGSFEGSATVKFIKCSDLDPGTTKTSGFLTLTNIHIIPQNRTITAGPTYDWNDNLNEFHFDINNDSACNGGSTHEYFPHTTRARTETGSWAPGADIDGVLMLENGLYVGFENFQ